MPPGAFEFLTRPITEVWTGLIQRAVQAKREFTTRGDQIEQFYSAASGFMWSGDYMSRFMGGSSGVIAPKFKITVNKAWEFLAVMQPMLFWQMADRKVRARKNLPFDPTALAGRNEQLFQKLQQVAQQHAEANIRNEQRALVLEHMLNYFKDEQPGGGISPHINQALFDALLRGAGFMTTENYRFPMSDKNLVRSEYVGVGDVIADPDSKDPLWIPGKTRWIGIRHENTYSEVEEMFSLPPGSLQGYGARASNSSTWEAGRTDLPSFKQKDTGRDLLEWYEIFSVAGCGNKLTGTRQPIAPEFDEVLHGGAAYLCICKHCPYPLNLPSGTLAEGATPEWVREQLRWPTEFWEDSKWPISKLAFYPHSSKSLWPEPPLAAALGELTVLNILISAYVQGVYDNRQQLIGVLKGCVDDLQGLVQSNKSPLVIEIDYAGQLKRSLNDTIQFMNRTEVNGEVPRTIEFVMHLIEQRTGLSDRMQGITGGATPRSAEETRSLQSGGNLRPEYMQKLVAEWQSAVADKEVYCAYSHVASSDIADQLGPGGVMLWDELVTKAQPEEILRGCSVTVEASAMARPNKQRDAEMLDRMSQVVTPVLAAHASQFNDPKPLNGFWRAIGDATEIDVDKFLIPEPEPDNEAIQAHKAMQQAELSKTQAEAQKLSAEAQAAGMQGQTAQQDAMIKERTATHSLTLKEKEAALRAQIAEHGMAVRQAESDAKVNAARETANIKGAAAAQTIAQKQQQADLDTQAKHGNLLQAMAIKDQEARAKLGSQLLQSHQGLLHQEATHQQTLTQADERAAQDAKHSALITMSKLMMHGLEAQARQREAS